MRISVAIVFVEAVLSAEPHEASFVFQDRGNVALGQPLIGCQVPELQILTLGKT